jgi:hypothetical protein
MFTDNVIAALIGLVGAVLTGGVGWISGRRLKRENVFDVNLSAQLTSWRDFAASLRSEITELRERVEECERDRANLWRQLANRRPSAEC